MTTSTPRVLVPSAAAKGEVIKVKTIISHQMETGLRHNSQVKSSRARSSTGLFAAMAVVVFSVDLHEAISANPFIEFYLRATDGGRLEFIWEEDGASLSLGTRTRGRLTMAWQLTPAETFKRRYEGAMCGGAKPLERTTTNGARLIFALLVATSPSFVVHQSAAAENNQGAQLAAMCAVSSP